MNTHLRPLDYMTMVEVADKLRLRDPESAQKWCHENHVHIYKVGKKHVSYAFDVEVATAKPFVLRLQDENPAYWKDLLRIILQDDVLYNYFLFKLDQPRNDAALAVVEPMDKEQESLLKRLRR